MKLDRWIQFHHKLVGYSYDDLSNSNGERVITGLVRYIHPDLTYAVVVGDDGETNDKISLGTPGTYYEHDQPLIGKPKDSSDGLENPINESLFLNPEG